MPKSQIQPLRKKAPKPKARKVIPTRPEHQFPDPYSRLLSLGEDPNEELPGQIAEILRKQNAAAAVKKLVEMAQDETWYDYNEDDDTAADPRGWTRLNAVRVLTHMGDAASAAVEPLLTLLDEEDDWLREEMPIFYASVGVPAIAPLQKVLQDGDADTYMRTGASDSLEQIAEAHPDVRDQVVTVLEQALATEISDDVLAAFIVCNLLDLDAKETLPTIEEAFKQGRVDESVVGMEDVEEHFELAPPRSKSPLGMHVVSASEIEEAVLRPVTTDHEVAPQTPYIAPVKLGRNEPCWCGSGKKFKACHGG